MIRIRTKRRNLEMQGFTGLDDATLLAVEPWLRLSPALCLIGVAIGTITASEWILWGLVPFAIGGVVLRNHPFDVIYNVGIRRLTCGPELPTYGVPRRFSCAVAALWMGATGFAFHTGALLLGYIMGCLMFALMELQVLTGFCTPSWIYSKLIGTRADTSEIPSPSAALDR